MNRRILCTLLSVLLLCGCQAGAGSHSDPTTTATSTPPATDCTTIQTEPPPSPLELLADSLSTEELVGQLFLVRFPGPSEAKVVLDTYHPGGFILFGKDFKNETPDTIAAILSSLQQSAFIPLLMATDEEGGTVNRVSIHPQYRSNRFYSPRYLFSQGGLPLIIQTEEEKCQLLQSVGINVNMAPVCDITTDPSAFMYNRSLGQSPQTTAEFISSAVETMAKVNVGSVLKHFPGYGNNTDTHTGIAVDQRPLSQLEQKDLIPFSAGINAGCNAILVSHTIVSALDDTMPASLSPAVIGYLRSTMGFDGVVVTDDLVMDAITDAYGTAEAAVLAVLAGNDLLCSSEYEAQYQAVLEAVQNGRITRDRLKESVIRILQWKQDIGLIT